MAFLPPSAGITGLYPLFISRQIENVLDCEQIVDLFFLTIPYLSQDCKVIFRFHPFSFLRIFENVFASFLIAFISAHHPPFPPTNILVIYVFVKNGQFLQNHA